MIVFDSAVLCSEVTGQDLYEGRFTRPIGADDQVQLARLERDRDVGEQLAAGYGIRNVLCDEH